jgi:dTDP-4-dehydrorhamnose reductase
MSHSSFELLDDSRPILVFGRDGQVGRALQICLKKFKAPVIFLGRADCDLTRELSIVEVLNWYKPKVIINAAAYTSVDAAETEQDLAFAINAKAPELMARYVANVAHGILIHYSTEYVFADTKDEPYDENDLVGPAAHLNVYGQSKLAGEKAIEEVFNLINHSNYSSYIDKFSKYFILRTSWVYGDGDNFIRTILHLANESNKLKVVANQSGTPTSARWLAEVSGIIISSRVESGIYHVVPNGETSWYKLAIFVIETLANNGGGSKLKSENVLPILGSDYQASAKRPYNSRLSNVRLKKLLSLVSSNTQFPCWQEQVEAYIKECVTNSLKI